MKTAPAQRGAALLLAMVTVTLVAVLAAATQWQQWRDVEVESADRTRVQSVWILTGALDWARLILREDARSGGPDHLGEPWAVALQESRLSTFLAADRNNNSADLADADNSFLSGSISDQQALLNVLNLVEKGTLSEPDHRAFLKLFALLGLPQRQLAALEENMRFAADTSPDNRSGTVAPLLPQRMEQLLWLGLPRETIAVLEPYITLLPTRTAVNLNTASAEVIYASIPGLDMDQAQRLVAERDRAHFRNLADVINLVPSAGSQVNDNLHSVSSRFFLVRGRLRQDHGAVEERSLLQRDGLEVRTLWRERMPASVMP